MKRLSLAVAIIGLTLSGFGQGSIFIDNNNANGYLVISAGNRYSGVVGIELWYKNSAAATDTAINSLNGLGVPGQAYALLTADGFTLASHINPFDPAALAHPVAGGIVSGFGEVDIPGIDRTVNSGGALFGVAFWTGYSSTFLGGAYGGVLTFNNPTADYTLQPPPAAPAMDNWPVDLVIGIPEPGVFVLAGLGAAVLLVFPRRHA